MNNNNPFQIMRAMQNPQRYFNEIMTNGQVMNDPRCRRTIEMLQRHDEPGLRAMAENICQEYGTTVNEMQSRLNNIMNM